MQDNLVVKMSRKFIAMLIAVGLLFFVVGGTLIIMWLTKSMSFEGNKFIIFIIFEIFACGGGILIIISQIKNFIQPYTMLEVTAEGLKFATGANYKLFLVSWNLVESSEVVSNQQLRVMDKYPVNDLVVHFKNDAKLEASMATGSGLMYMNYVLTINGIYMAVKAETISNLINSKARK
jgi:hypothetical protein